MFGHHSTFALPLIYGMQYDGGEIKYRYQHGGRIEVLAIEPSTSSEDWPYPEYPPHLPYFELEVRERRPQKWSGFVEEFIGQPAEQPSEAVVVVPPPKTLGVSLWGRDGDEEGVEIVFECNLEEQTVVAFNRCT